MTRFSLSTFLVPAAFAIAASAGVANAQSSADYRCSGLPDQVRAAVAQSTDHSAKARAERFLATGNSLCNARAEGAAARQYRSALRVLSTPENAPEGNRAIAGNTAGGAAN